MIRFWSFFAGVIFTHLLYFFGFLLVCAWENRGGVPYTRRRSDP